jgi:carboxylesterase type B
MMSDLAKGLFHRAIPMSGTSFIKSWAFADKPELTERLAKRLGWDGTGGERKILEVLEKADANEIVEVESKLLTDEEIMHEHIMFPFTPVVEPYITENTFMAEDPVLAGRNAWSNDIDCLIGGTSLEGSLFGMFPSFSHFYDFYQNPKDFVTRELKLNPEKDEEKINQLGEKIMKFYFGNELPNANNRIKFLTVRYLSLSFVGYAIIFF